MDAVNGQQTEMKPEDHDQSFLGGVLESLMEKCSVLKTRSGRAGLVHNFLRGLQLMAAQVLSGEPRLLLVCLIVCLCWFVICLFVWAGRPSREGKSLVNEVEANPLLVIN